MFTELLTRKRSHETDAVRKRIAAWRRLTGPREGADQGVRESNAIEKLEVK